MTPHCCWSTVAAPVYVDAGALVVDGGPLALTVAVADTVAGAAELPVAPLADEAGAAGAEPEGSVMVTPPERQNCWAKARVAIDGRVSGLFLISRRGLCYSVAES